MIVRDATRMTTPTPPPPPDSGKTVIVTGAAKRLGRDIALALAKAGWQVAIHFRGSEHEAKETAAQCTELSGHSGIFFADLQNEAQVRGFLERHPEFHETGSRRFSPLQGGDGFFVAMLTRDATRIIQL